MHFSVDTKIVADYKLFFYCTPKVFFKAKTNSGNYMNQKIAKSCKIFLLLAVNSSECWLINCSSWLSNVHAASFKAKS